jgi:hypothetical protein
MGAESVRIAKEVFSEMSVSPEHLSVHVPIGLQVEQVGVKSEQLTLELLDRVYHDFRRQ